MYIWFLSRQKQTFPPRFDDGVERRAGTNGKYLFSIPEIASLGNLLGTARIVS